jgi:hypothetical protein
LWAAFAGLANASAACRGIPIGFANPALYSIASSNYLNNFHDVTEPSFLNRFANNNPEGKGLFPVATGYDMATGLGTPIGANLAASLCAIASPVFSVGVGNPGPQTSVATQPVALQITGSDSGGATLSYHASGLPEGLAISPDGLISGTPTTPGTTSVTVTARDTKANSSSTTFEWTINAPPPAIKPPIVEPPVISHVSVLGISKRTPKLRFTISTADSAPAFNTIAVSLSHGMTFSRSAKSLLKGIVVKGVSGKRIKFTAKVRGEVLTITLVEPVRTAQFSLSAPAVGVTSSLASKVRRHKLKSLNIAVSVTDTSHTTTRHTLNTKA